MNPSQFTADERAGLIANMPRLSAQERLSRPEVWHSSPDDLYDLVMCATGDEEQAHKARLARIAQMAKEAMRGGLRG